MSRGHHFTTCQFCNREYVCGDCITNECELGRGQRMSCERFKRVMAQHKAAATILMQKAKIIYEGKSRAGAILLADYHWDQLFAAMSDKDLADLVLEELWAEQKLGSKEGALLAEVIERLRGKPLTEGGEK